MSCIWNFFENANELAYVSDMDSSEILYMNRRMRDTYGISSIDELKGRKCYEVLYGNNFPCAMCSGEELKEGEFIERKYFNPVLNRSFLLMGTMTVEEGRRCRFELAIDITENGDSGQILDRHADLEAHINIGIRRAITEPDPEKAIGIILEFLGKELSGKRAYIFEKNLSGGDDNTYEWTAAGVTPEKDNLQNLSSEICENWYRSFDKNKNIVIDDIEKIRYDDPLQYDNLKKQNIRSVVVVPLYDDRQLTGFYGIDNPPAQDLDYTLNMLQIVGYFISSMIRRRDMLNQLREMSLCDQLTRLGNRHAMGEYVSTLRSSKSLGVVFCDITGLKRTNDTMGHEMGDDLIRRAADSLRSAFGEYGLFRIGGDELLVICEDIGKEELQARVELLRKVIVKKSVNLAIGSVWKEKYEDNLQKLMNQAEKLMYEEKSEYYRTAGIDRRR